MPAFTGSLHSNEIFTSIYNMIISQHVFVPTIADNFSSLLNSARVDGGLYGDTKLYYDTDVLETEEWGGASSTAATRQTNANNLLQLNYPASPDCQAITLDKFRFVTTTLDNYMSKRAFMNEGAFGEFQSVVLGLLADTKRVYETTLYNAFLGSHVSGATKNTITVNLDSAASGDPLYGYTGIDYDRKEAGVIAQAIADLVVDMKDVSTDYNDYGHLKAYNENDLQFVFNSKWVNKIREVDLPNIFNSNGLSGKLDKYILPARYFGVAITATNIATYSASTPTTGKPINSSTGAYTPGTNNANGCVRALKEWKGTVGGTTYHVFPGDELPAGATVGSGNQFGYEECYIVDEKIICKVKTADALPIMSAFEASTSFYNPRNLSTNHYLIWGYNTLEFLKAKPCITVKKK